VVDSHGTPIGYPPIHVHHVHISERISPSEVSPHLWETHGDFGTGTDWGVGAAATRTYAKHAPSGYFVPIRKSSQIWVYSIINDVRVATKPITSSLPDVWFYLEVAFALKPSASSAVPTTGQCRACSVMEVNTPIPCDHIARAFMMKDAFFRLNAPRYPAMMISTFTMPIGGRMLAGAWMHSHHPRFWGVVLLAAPPPVPQDKQSRFLAVGDLAATFRQLTLGPVICQNDPWVQSHITIQGFSKEGIPENSSYDRSSQLSCHPWTFERGVHSTHVVLVAPVWESEAQTFGFHIGIWFFFEPQNGSSVDRGIYSVRPSCYAEARLEDLGMNDLVFAIQPSASNMPSLVFSIVCAAATLNMLFLRRAARNPIF